jgi:hypothetical protein
MAKTGLYNVQTAYTQPNLPNVPSGFSQYSGGMNALARGVDNVGNTLSRIQQEYVQAQDASTFLKLETEFMQKTAELSAGLENHENPIRIPKDYEDGAKSILDGLIDSYGEKLSARGVDHIRNQLGFSIQRQVIQQTEFARQRLIDDAAVNFDAAYQAEMESRIKSGNFDIAAMEQWTKDTLDSLTVGVNTETEGRIPANIFSRDQSYWMVQKYNTKTASVMAKQAESAMRTALESHVAAVIAAEGFDAAEAMVSDPKNIQAMVDKYGLSIADVSALQSDMRGFVAAEKAKETQAKVQRVEDQRKQAFQYILSDDIDQLRKGLDFLKDSELDDRETRATAIQAKIKALGNDKDTPITSQVEVEKILSSVARGTVKRDDAITQLMKTKGVNSTDMSAYMKRLFAASEQADKSPMTPQQNRALDVIDRLRSARISFAEATLDKDEPELEAEKQRIEIQMYKVSNDLLEWFKKNPDATDDEIEKKADTLTRPIVQAETQNAIVRMLRPKTGPGFILASEETREMDLKIKALKKNGVWQTLTPDEQESVKTGLKSGMTVEEIVRMANAD